MPAFVRLRRWIDPVSKLFGPKNRRAWMSDTRAHIEFRRLDPDELESFVREVEREARSLDPITWVQVNAYTRRVVFEFSPGRCSLDDLTGLVERAEQKAHVADAALAEDLPEHPADAELGLRQMVELAADLAALSVGLGLRILPFGPPVLAGNAAGLLSLVKGTPRLRQGFEDRLGRARAELVLNLAASFMTAVAQRPMTSLVDASHKSRLLRETVARRRAWLRLEEELNGAGEPELVGAGRVDARPCALPPGPIEEYADRAWVVALASFGVSFATTRSVQRAIAAIYGSLPRPARLGRDVFAAELGQQLAARDVLVLDSEALRRLDRIDCLILPGDLVDRQRFVLGRVTIQDGVDEGEARSRLSSLFDPERPLDFKEREGWQLGPWRQVSGQPQETLEQQAKALARSGALVLGLSRDGVMVGAVEVEVVARTGLEEIVAAAHAAQVRVVIASRDETVLQAVNADDVIDDKDGLRVGIRRLQREGRAVCLVTRGDSDASGAADLTIGLRQEGRPVPWGAHVICRDDLVLVRFILESCVRARAVSKQSVNIALGAASLGALVSAGGLLRMTGRRVLFVVNSATLISMANGSRGAAALDRLALPSPRDPTPWHALEAEGVIERLGSSRYGLGRRDALARRAEVKPRRSALGELSDAITDELFNPLAPLLAAGAGLSAAVGSMADASMVGGVAVLNAVVGGMQRFRTDRKIRDLSRLQERRAAVRREGKVQIVDAGELVRGDLVLLNAGDVVPADCRIVEASSLEVDASSQTGESLPVRKTASPSYEAEVADRSSMIYEGTTIAAGQATAVVVAVGDETEARRGAAVAKGGRAQGGVEKRLRSLMGLTTPIALAAGVGVVGGGLLRGRKLDELVGSAVSLAVASVPEGLPLLATAAQLSAAERLSQRRALVRNARSIEALGRVDVICLDKTGTVTEGRLALTLVSDGQVDEEAEALTAGRRPVLSAAMRATIRAADGSGVDPTDEALEQGAAKAFVSEAHDRPGWMRRADLSLEVGRSYHAVLGRDARGGVLSVKGAPEALLLSCARRQIDGEAEPLDDAARLALLGAATRLASRGLRVLAVAERSIASDVRLSASDVQDLTFRGFIAFSDPVRESAKKAIEGLSRAGVDTVMMTGDHPSTAEAIAAELDLLRGRSLLTGAELAELADEELDGRIEQIAVYARVTPSQKVRVVRALQRAGRTVGMAGDGANDAAAIRLADVGIAVGESSTAAARGAADIVLTDGRVETLVDAITEGRAMWASVRSAVSILMGGNLGEIGFTLGAGLVDGRPPLHARQLLLVNLLTDVAPAMAIAFQAPGPRTFEALAKETPDQALGQPLNRELATRAIVTALGASGAWTFGRLTGSRAKARTIGLASLVGTQLGQTLVSGGFSRPVVLTGAASALFLASIIQTPGISHFFGCRPMGPIAWSATIGASALATALSPNVASFVARLAESGVPEDQLPMEVIRRLTG